jgi:hypothetical protein
MRVNKIVVLLLFSMFDLSAQTYPKIDSNGFKSDIIDYIKLDKNLKNCDFILMKYEDSYWRKVVNYRLICFKDNQTELVEIQRKKKNNKFSVTHKKKVEFNSYIVVIDSLKSCGLFDLKSTDLNADKQDEFGNTQRKVISDGICVTFETYSLGRFWGLEIYEPKLFFDFSGNKNYLIVLNSIDLFNRQWK